MGKTNTNKGNYRSVYFFLQRWSCGEIMVAWIVRSSWELCKFFYLILTWAAWHLAGINYFQPLPCANLRYSHPLQVPWCPPTRASRVNHRPHLSTAYPHRIGVDKLTCTNTHLSASSEPRRRHVDNHVLAGPELKWSKTKEITCDLVGSQVFCGD